MTAALRRAIERSEYRVDPHAVAGAMLARAQALRAARLAPACSEVLVAADEIEVRRIAARELDALPLERTA